ncbi:MAG: alanine/glycine:cation symporter family protein, partial [Planctomycetota bacterium]
RFVNLRMFGHAIQVVRGRYDNPDDHGEVSHFQALSAALSATVGLGNIAGVAIAVSMGGPGATFWMICAGLLGMTLKFTECTLGQKYRKIDAQGRVSGGPMHYLRDGLAEKGFGVLGSLLAGLFIIFCIGASLAGGNAFQVNQSLGVLADRYEFFADNGWVYGVVMAIMVGIVIIGGIKSIAKTAEKIVPTMCLIYVIGALLVIFNNIDAVPAAFGAIFGGAFSPDAMYGGFIGSLVVGFQRAAFSNEAGIGSAAIAHSAARTEYPVREGIVALLEPFIDTVVVCTMTALVIVITGVFNNPEHVDLIANNKGAALTSEAFASVDWMASWFPPILLAAMVLFAFSTMISWSYYGERCWTRIFGQRASLSYKFLFLVFVVLGSILSATKVLEFGDLMILIMAFPNILGLYFLKGVVKKELDEYQAGLASGEIKPYK